VELTVAAHDASVSGVLVKRDGGVVRLTLNRPHALNAMDVDTAGALLDACRTLRDDPTMRVVLVTGAGRGFSSGGDIAAMRANPIAVADALIGPLHEVVSTLASIDAPVVAAVHGAVAGAGLSLAAAADIVIAAEDARFNLAYVRVGASCDLGASWTLPRRVGLGRALEIALLGDSFDALHALHLGLVSKVVANDALAAEAQALASRLARGPTQAFGEIKRLMRSSFQHALPKHLEEERRAFLRCAATPDFNEGLRAFLEKRPPRFGGESRMLEE
jgi:2-(1,2-epoxy-1,2-dihydrophenyl)acetyl-CoA isomerase